MEYKVTTSIVLDKRRPIEKKNPNEKEDRYPVKLRVFHKNKYRYYGTNYYLTINEFDTITKTNPRNENLKKIKLSFADTEREARQLIAQIKHFSFDKFKEVYDNRDNDNQDVYNELLNYAKQLRENEKISTAESYEVTRNSLKTFKEKLSFDDITPAFLQAYENWMLNEGRSKTTVGIYCRNLRHVYNEAIRKGIIQREQYPFGPKKDKKYTIPKGENIKKALTLKEIERIFNYQTIPGTKHDYSKDMWIFSYLTNGINLHDIAELKYKDIDNDTVSFIRAKTKDTAKEHSRKVQALLTPQSKKIIKKWGNEKHPDNYVFPIFYPGITAERKRAVTKQTIKTINKYMKKIAEDCDIPKKVTTYAARHSFATVLKNSGAPIHFISECLAHHDLKTTESYLGSIEDETRKTYFNKLTEF
ncbi:MAG: tyrosine-type recombinase/integrase [bacterium]